jgi:hypothetical protein
MSNGPRDTTVRFGSLDLLTPESGGVPQYLLNGVSTALANVTPINSLEDFPDPVGGVIELTNGADVAYSIDAAVMDLGANKFSITGGSVCMKGSSPFITELLTTASGFLFEINGGSILWEFIQFNCPNARVFDFSGTGFNSIVGDRVVVSSALGVGCISGAFSSTFSSLTVVSTTVDGIVWTGLGNNQINMRDTIGLGWTGALFDLGTATFSLISIGNNNRLLSPGGTTILSGMANNGNLGVLGKAVVEGNFFNGTGTALSGITKKDLQWKFAGNTGVADSVAVGSYSKDAASTTTINTVNVWERISGATTVTPSLERYTQTADNTIRYDDEDEIQPTASASITCEKTGATKFFEFAFGIDTGSGPVIDSASIIQAEVKTTLVPVSLVSSIVLNNEDDAGIFVRNVTDADNIIIDSMNVVLK